MPKVQASEQETILPIESLAPPPPVIEALEIDSTSKETTTISSNIAASLSPSPPKVTTKQILSLTALFATLFISALNATIIATAIPTIVHEFSSPSGYAWISAAYLLGSTATSPIWAKLSDIWGRKPILLSAVVGYAVFSMVCALATSMTMLIVGRALQGMAGGGLISLVSIVICDMFSMRQRGFYLGMTEIVWTVACGVGPVMGGAFSQHLSWRWIFWIVLPIASAAFLLLIFALDVHNPRTPLVPGLKAIDWAGSVTILGLLVMLLLGLNFGGAEYPWNSPTVICLLIFGLLMIGIFVFCERRLSRYPLIPMAIFSSRSNIAVLFVVFTKRFALMTIDFYFPLFFQSARNASPTESGYLILPANLMTCAVGFLSGIIMARTGRYLDLIYAGVTLITVGFGLFLLWTPTSTLGLVAGTQLIAGCLGFLLSTTYVALQSHLPPSMTATATGTIALIGNIAAILSVVVGQTIFQNSLDEQNGRLVAAGVPTNVSSSLSGQYATANLGLIVELESVEQQMLVRDVFSTALRSVWILTLAVSAAAVVASGLIGKAKLSREHVEARTGIEKEPGREGSQV